MRIAVVAEGDFHRNNRLLKLAHSLTRRGHTVARFGIRTARSEPLNEMTDEGEIIRTVTRTEDLVSVGHEGGGPGFAARLGLLTAVKHVASLLGPTDDMRHYFGRRRECSLLYGSVRSWNPDAVVCVNPTTMRVGAWAQRELSALFIYDAQEIWVETCPRRRRVMRALYSRLERRLARKCDLVLTVNDEIADLMARRMRIERPMVLMNGASECLVPTPVHAPLRVLFQGAFAPNRGIIPFVRQMHNLKDRAVLTLQGFGAMEEELRSLVREEGLEESVRFMDPCSPNGVIASANDHDVGLMLWPLTSENLVYASPNKLFDYLGAGLALLAVDSPVLRRIITAAHCGVLVSPGRIDTAWEVASALVDDPDRVQMMKEAAHRLCPSLLWDVVAEPFLDWIEVRQCVR